MCLSCQKTHFTQLQAHCLVHVRCEGGECYSGLACTLCWQCFCRTLFDTLAKTLLSPLQNIRDCLHDQQPYYLMIFKSVSRQAAKTHSFFFFLKKGKCFHSLISFPLSQKLSLHSRIFFFSPWMMNISKTTHPSTGTTTLMVTVHKDGLLRSLLRSIAD